VPYHLLDASKELLAQLYVVSWQLWFCAGLFIRFTLYTWKRLVKLHYLLYLELANINLEDPLHTYTLPCFWRKRWYFVSRYSIHWCLRFCLHMLSTVATIALVIHCNSNLVLPRSKMKVIILCQLMCWQLSCQSSIALSILWFYFVIIGLLILSEISYFGSLITAASAGASPHLELLKAALNFLRSTSTIPLNWLHQRRLGHFFLSFFLSYKV
jgi:hypothetical protein